MTTDVKRALGALGVISAVCVAGPAAANDGTYSLDAGGLTLTQADNIAIESENLSIAFSKIGVHYVFANPDAQAKSVTIGFPIPHPAGLPRDSDGPGPGGVTRMLQSFTIAVDGKAREPDNNVALIEGFVPADPEDWWNEAVHAQTFDLTPGFVAEGYDTLDPDLDIDKALADDARRKAILSHLPRVPDGWKPNFENAYLLPTWKQTFPGEAQLAISHSYVPEPGTQLLSNFDVRDADNRPIPPDEEKLESATKDMMEYLRQTEIDRLKATYGADTEIDCSIDDAGGFKAALRQWHAGAVADPEGGYRDDKGVTSRPVLEERVTYVLTTARSWTGPIGRFHLTVDGETKPVFFCFPGKITRPDAGKFAYEVEVTGFRPAANLTVTRLR